MIIEVTDENGTTVEVLSAIDVQVEVVTESNVQIDFTTPGPQGIQGPAGPAAEDEFESVSKNLKSWNAVFAYSSGKLSTITYTSGADEIVKTFNYTGDKLTNLVLSGDTPTGISLTKTFSYTLDNLTGVSYT